MSSVRVEGFEELDRKLRDLARRVSPAQQETAIRAGLLLVEGTAKRLAPVLTGALRSSLHVETRSDRNGATGRVGSNLEYAPFVELGTYRQRPQPYLRPAYEQERAAALREVAATLRDLING